MTKSTLTASIHFEIPFHDIDSMQIAWHGHYAKYFENARTALLRKIGYDCQQMIDSGFAWPVVNFTLKYIKPLRYAQQAQVVAELVEYENQLKINYQIINPVSQELISKGSTTQLAIDMNTGETLFVTPMALQERVLAYLAKAPSQIATTS